MVISSIWLISGLMSKISCLAPIFVAQTSKNFHRFMPLRSGQLISQTSIGYYQDIQMNLQLGLSNLCDKYDTLRFVVKLVFQQNIQLRNSLNSL